MRNKYIYITLVCLITISCGPSKRVVVSQDSSLGRPVTAVELRNIIENGDTSVQVIDLRGERVDLSRDRYKTKSSHDLIIKNGSIDLLGLTFLETKKVVLEDVTITIDRNFASACVGQGLVSLYCRNCSIINDNKQGIGYFINSTKSVVFENCYFENCGISLGVSDSNSGMNSDFRAYINNCHFKWDGAHSSKRKDGNMDAINCQSNVDLTVSGCTFESITNSCIDAYMASDVIVTNNKFIHCAGAVTFKSIFIKDTESNLSFSRCHNFLFSNNVIDEIYGATINLDITNGTDLEKNLDRVKQNCIISNNTVYCNEYSDDQYRYFICGCFIGNTLICNNVMYASNSNVRFIRDSELYDAKNLSIWQSTLPRVVIRDCEIIKNTEGCSFKNDWVMEFGASEVVIEGCKIEGSINASRGLIGTTLRLEGVNICGDVIVGAPLGKSYDVSISSSTIQGKLVSYSSNPLKSIVLNHSSISGGIDIRNDVSIGRPVVYSLNGSVAGVYTNRISNINRDNVIVGIVDMTSSLYKIPSNTNYLDIRPFDNKRDLMSLGLDANRQFCYRKGEKMYYYSPQRDAWYTPSGEKDL